MIRGVRGRLVVVLMAGAVALVLVWAFLAGPLLERGAVTAASEDLRRVARSALGAVRRPGADVDAVADRVGAERGARIEVIDPDGVLRGDTGRDGDAIRLEPAAREPELRGARQRGVGVSERVGPDGAVRLYVAVHASGWTVRASRPLAAVRGSGDALAVSVIFAALIGLALSVSLATLISRTVVQPIEALTESADALARGNLGVRMRSQRADEIGTLERAFDRMAQQLEERLEAIRAEEARLRTVIDAMEDGVLVTDPDGRIVLHNRAATSIAEGRVIGRTSVEAIRSGELHEAVQAALRGQPSSVELEVGTRDRRSLVAQVAPLPQRAGAVAVLHDVTERKRADQIRRDFVANASHELRTPLTAIRGFAETLRDGAIEDAVVARRFLDTILDHTRRLERLTQDLLELSKSESATDRLPLAPVDVRALAAKVVQGLSVAAAERRVDLALEPASDDVIANAEERALDQVLVNLVDNAVKYTPEGGQVRVRVTPERDWAAIEVDDTGPGIAAHHLPRIFERFYRVDPGRAREVGGTGLGLAIVKHMVQRMGGQVSVQSTVGKGTTFRVRLRAHEVRD